MTGGNKGRPRSQLQKSKGSVGEAFTLFRRVEEESADTLYELMLALMMDNVLPEHTEFRRPGDMRVTYIERHRLSRQLQGYAAGFNSAEAVRRINNRCRDRNNALKVSLGRVGLMDRRDEALVVRLDHSQIVAEEYEEVSTALRTLNVPGVGSDTFRPHITLAKITGLPAKQKADIAKQVQEVMPDTVMLLPLDTYPKNPRERRV